MLKSSKLRAGAAVALWLGTAALAGPLEAQERRVPETYTAVTANMTPADVELKVDVLQWSTEAEREAVIAALADEDPVAALKALPSNGVVWRSGSAVGNSIKYSHREVAADGSEIITLVTDRAVGSMSFTPWQADDPAVDAPPPYSVIVLDTGNGAEGSMSLAAAVVIDRDAATVSLDRQTGAPLLTDVVKQPPPYWARSGD